MRSILLLLVFCGAAHADTLLCSDGYRDFGAGSGQDQIEHIVEPCSPPPVNGPDEIISESAAISFNVTLNEFFDAQNGEVFGDVPPPGRLPNRIPDVWH